LSNSFTAFTVRIPPNGMYAAKPSSRSFSLLSPSYPFTTDVARLAGKLDAERRAAVS